MQGVLEALRGNAVLIGLVVGTVTPLLVSVVQQPSLSHEVRQRIAIGASVLVGLVVAASTDSLDFSDGAAVDLTRLTGVIAAVWAASEAFYQKVWKPTGVTQAVESATSPRTPEPVQDADPGDLDYR